MKKILCLLLTFLLLLTACTDTPDPSAEQKTELTAQPYELHTLDEEGLSLATRGTEPFRPETAVTWVATELVLNAQKTYKDCYNDVDVDMLLSNGTDTYRIPGFWDGDNVWRVRFLCPSAGQWSYETVCTDTGDEGLHGVKGTLTCTAYTGKLAIYQHGFLKTDNEKRCFTYADGTPFFYLGDTHWSLGGESPEMVTKMTDQRVKQGFTVIQSEPIDAKFDLTDGVGKKEARKFEDFDRAFQIIAEHGLVHANAEFFFPSSMDSLIKKNGGYDKNKPYGSETVDGKPVMFYDLTDTAKAALERVSRYWVARYSAYPVLWTLGQEVDNDFHWQSNHSHDWIYTNNPYKLVAQYVAAYDPYTHPLSAHMEGASMTAASQSAFRGIEAHSWWAVQWSQTLTEEIQTRPLIDFYEKGQSKPTILYESLYCYLWTKNFGARAQGWIAYLSGMYGYGWGAQDTWSYKNPYDENADSNDGMDVITAAEKSAATYEDSLEYPSAYQVGYMRAFMEEIVGNWCDLKPRFNDFNYLARDNNALAVCASTDNAEKAVCYFYQTSSKELAEKPNAANDAAAKETGTLKALTPKGKYGYIWFDPVKGQTTENGTFTADAEGKWEIPEKAIGDMVLYVYRIK